MLGANEFAWLGLCSCAKKRGNTSWLAPPGTRLVHQLPDPSRNVLMKKALMQSSRSTYRCTRFAIVDSLVERRLGRTKSVFPQKVVFSAPSLPCNQAIR